MIYLDLYLVIGGIVTVPLTEAYDRLTRAQYVLATAITVVAWPFVVINALALIYTHWNDVE
ncbi:MAG: hypothetical protein EOP89_01420 [Lysobacteraceae bacterium]|nr:MAG: hypothetical protein EOP89_01420 [Xanthomonadaceae bacterium]